MSDDFGFGCGLLAYIIGGLVMAIFGLWAVGIPLWIGAFALCWWCG